MREWFRSARESKDMSRKELAGLVKVDPSFISKIEKNQRDPSVILAMKLGKILNFDWKEFYTELEKQI